jgi:hypothetical protein
LGSAFLKHNGFGHTPDRGACGKVRQTDTSLINIAPTVFWNPDIISLNGPSLFIVAACGTSASLENDVLTVESYFGLHHGF